MGHKESNQTKQNSENIVQCPLLHVTCTCKLPTVLQEMILQENILFDLDLGVRITENIVQYPLLHVTYAPAKFEVATCMSISLGRQIYKKICYINLGPWGQG